MQIHEQTTHPVSLLFDEYLLCLGQFLLVCNVIVLPIYQILKLDKDVDIQVYIVGSCTDRGDVCRQKKSEVKELK